MKRTVTTTEDVLDLLDELIAPLTDHGNWWDRFYAERNRDVPFFVDKPDENLAAHLDQGLIPPGARVLDLGCGPGRNAVHLATRGFDVDAVDLSATALAWGKERAAAADASVRFHHGNIFDVQLPHASYDVVYDSGCLHHLAPHRRISYLALLDRLLAPGGHFGLVCFAAGEMGSERPDAELYREGVGLEGGLAFTEDELRHVFREFTEVEIRPMAARGAESATFGQPFLLTAMFRRTPR
ncbi:methyltransferase domain-containing protein [Streptomyces sp. SID8379]|uniref:class I SAM-dependent methyltransferase n=1 Tax=unclassified Streptomyces TaxID=2593676 RepID=UPI0003719CE7|nr:MULTISPECIES: class I SAM-dependent methyltransferase [unclassified Streptomyces]MYW66814.1 methyltransferase domain-containing protein [Streptomyces sp. SID8379]